MPDIQRTTGNKVTPRGALKAAALSLLLATTSVPAAADQHADRSSDNSNDSATFTWQSSLEEVDHDELGDAIWYRKPDYRVGIYTSVYTTHFNPRPEHNNTQKLLSVELYGNYFRPAPMQLEHDWLGLAKPFAGIASFKNSYHQDTIYAYLGIQQNLTHSKHFKTYAKLTAGFIHGYRGEYRDKIPFNTIGIAPAAVPMVGFQYQRFMGEMILFGASGIMLTAGFRF